MTTKEKFDVAKIECMQLVKPDTIRVTSKGGGTVELVDRDMHNIAAEAKKAGVDLVGLGDTMYVNRKKVFYITPEHDLNKSSLLTFLSGHKVETPKGMPPNVLISTLAI